jgi:hypothetical protein
MERAREREREREGESGGGGGRSWRLRDCVEQWFGKLATSATEQRIYSFDGNAKNLLI